MMTTTCDGVLPAPARSGPSNAPGTHSPDRAESRLVACAVTCDAPSRSRNKERTKARLLEMAVAEFGRTGIRDGRIDSISTSAGLHKKLVYYYFEDKDGLFAATVAHAIARTNAGIADFNLAGQGLERLLLAGLEFFSSQQDLARFLTTNWSWLVEQKSLVACRLYQHLVIQAGPKRPRAGAPGPLMLYHAVLQMSALVLLNRTDDDAGTSADRLKRAAAFIAELSGNGPVSEQGL
ncbi:TetR/AcrR family transcriptional regulator [Variovorax boronicumulans]